MAMATQYATYKDLSAKRGATQADKALRVLRAFLNFGQFHYEDADERPPLPDNPVRRLSQTRAWNRPKRRMTYVKPDQLAAWFETVLVLNADAANLFCKC